MKKLNVACIASAVYLGLFHLLLIVFLQETRIFYEIWGTREPISTFELVFYGLFAVALLGNLICIFAVNWQRAYRFRLSMIAYCIAAIPSAVVWGLLLEESFLLPLLDVFWHVLVLFITILVHKQENPS